MTHNTFSNAATGPASAPTTPAPPEAVTTLTMNNNNVDDDSNNQHNNPNNNEDAPIENAPVDNVSEPIAARTRTRRRLGMSVSSLPLASTLQQGLVLHDTEAGVMDAHAGQEVQQVTGQGREGRNEAACTAPGQGRIEVIVAADLLQNNDGVQAPQAATTGNTTSSTEIDANAHPCVYANDATQDLGIHAGVENDQPSTRNDAGVSVEAADTATHVRTMNVINVDPEAEAEFAHKAIEDCGEEGEQRIANGDGETATAQSFADATVRECAGEVVLEHIGQLDDDAAQHNTDVNVLNGPGELRFTRPNASEAGPDIFNVIRAQHLVVLGVDAAYAALIAQRRLPADARPGQAAPKYPVAGRPVRQNIESGASILSAPTSPPLPLGNGANAGAIPAPTPTSPLPPPLPSLVEGAPIRLRHHVDSRKGDGLGAQEGNADEGRQECVHQSGTVENDADPAQPPSDVVGHAATPQGGPAAASTTTRRDKGKARAIDPDIHTYTASTSVGGSGTPRSLVAAPSAAPPLPGFQPPQPAGARPPLQPRPRVQLQTQRRPATVPGSAAAKKTVVASASEVSIGGKVTLPDKSKTTHRVTSAAAEGPSALKAKMKASSHSNGGMRAATVPVAARGAAANGRTSATPSSAGPSAGRAALPHGSMGAASSSAGPSAAGGQTGPRNATTGRKPQKEPQKELPLLAQNTKARAAIRAQRAMEAAAQASGATSVGTDASAVATAVAQVPPRILTQRARDMIIRREATRRRIVERAAAGQSGSTAPSQGGGVRGGATTTGTPAAGGVGGGTAPVSAQQVAVPAPAQTSAQTQVEATAPEAAAAAAPGAEEGNVTEAGSSSNPMGTTAPVGVEGVEADTGEEEGVVAAAEAGEDVQKDQDEIIVRGEAQGEYGGADGLGRPATQARSGE